MTLAETVVLDLPSQWMNAAGSLGFAPAAGQPLPAQLGLFVTHPISLAPRRAAQAVQLLEFPGGVLLHSGLPNPGLSATLKKHASAWKRAAVPIIVHLLAQSAEELRKMVLRIEGLENVLAVEIGVPADASASLARELCQAGRGELPVIAQLPLPRALELCDLALQAGAAAISLGPARGSLPGAGGQLVSGRLYGPALLPQALEATRQLADQAPVIAAGGVYSQADGEALLAAGARAVQVDVGLWGAGNW